MLSFIDYHEICNSNVLFYAHIQDDHKETLQEHIERCQSYFQELYEDKNIEKRIKYFHQSMHFHNENATFEFLKDLFVQLVSFHDFGKMNPQFQIKKMKNKTTTERKDLLTDTDHSFFSALIYLDYFWNKLDMNQEMNKDDKKRLKYIILEHAYIIARHHSDLDDFSKFVQRFNEPSKQKLIKNLLSDPLNGYKGLFFIDIHKIQLLIRNMHKGAHKCTQEQSCLKYFYYRLAYSLLVASDYYATSEYMNGHNYDIKGDTLSIQEFQDEYSHSDLLKSIRDYEKKSYQGTTKHFEDISDINGLRSELFLDAERSLLNNMDKSIYFLEAPTGSGKSNTAFNLSFHLMQNRKKLFYIYPFNTLVEQNRQVLNKLFPQQKYQDQIVVVNSLTPLPQSYKNCLDFDDSSDFYQKLLLDRQFLNYPLILSTHVSFFNLLFGARKEEVIGFHQLSESVIVLDEIQSYKNQIWAEMIIMLENCAKLMDMKIIMMSATLPNLEELSGQSQVIKCLLPHCQLYYQHPLFKDRVKLHYELLDEEINLEKLRNHIINNQSKNKKILVEFILKDTAYKFYKMLLDSKDVVMDVKCLTGDDSLVEREKILKPIRSKTKTGLILIATQVIEAGVDIDMDIGYKDISLLDSEEQFLGRINRSCHNSGLVYFFNYDSYKMIYRGDFRNSDTLTLRYEEMRECLSNKNFSQYYHKVMKAMKNNRNNSLDANGLDYFINELIFKLNFPKVSERMKLIDDNYWAIDVVLCRKIELEDGTILDGWNIWNCYKKLLQDNEMDYSKRQVKLIEIRSQLSYFIYRFKNSVDIHYNDIIGELRCIEDASEYFVDGKLDRDKISKSSFDFL